MFLLLAVPNTTPVRAGTLPVGGLLHRLSLKSIEQQTLDQQSHAFWTTWVLELLSLNNCGHTFWPDFPNIVTESYASNIRQSDIAICLHTTCLSRLSQSGLVIRGPVPGKHTKMQFEDMNARDMHRPYKKHPGSKMALFWRLLCDSELVEVERGPLQDYHPL